MPTPVNPEEADRIAAELIAPLQRRSGGAYHVFRVAELPELEKFYYQVQATDEGDTLIGSGGFFVSLRTGEVEEIGSGACAYAYCYLRARDQLPPDVEPSVQELAALVAQHSCEQLIAMCQEAQRKSEGGSP